MSEAAELRTRAEALGATLPPLLAEAQHLASTVILGDHGRRQSGMGDAFWQFRTAQPGDPLRRIDWRRSGRGDQPFVRETEWQAAQSVMLWVDRSRSMAFTGDPRRPDKGDRARVLALALAVLLLRGGERVGLVGQGVVPRSGRAQAGRIAGEILHDTDADYGTPVADGLQAHGKAVFFGDFLGDLAAIEGALAVAADRGVTGALVQILDPAEEEFPFGGRTIFESMGGGLRHETLRASDLRARYLDRLAERKGRLDRAARTCGWHYLCHHTGAPAQAALLWLYRALERAR